MLYRISVDIESDSKIEDSQIFTYNGYHFTLVEDKKTKLINKIEISRKFENIKLLPQFKINKGAPHEIVFRENKDKNDMISLLMYLESLGSFWLGIKQVHFDTLEERWIPENQEEKKIIKIQSFTLQEQKYTKTPKPFNIQIVKNLIDKRDKLDYLTVPMHFYRMGLNEFESFNYYYSFLTFYLFLDILFSKGKFKSEHVIKSFNESKILRDAIHKTMHFYNINKDKELTINKYFLEEKLSLNKTKDVVQFIVRKRGEYFHFSLQDTRNKIMPNNQIKLEPIAFLLLTISTNVVSQVANSPNLREEIV